MFWLVPYAAPLLALALYVVLEFVPKWPRRAIVAGAILGLVVVPYLPPMRDVWAQPSGPMYAQVLTALLLHFVTVALLGVTRLAWIKPKRLVFTVIAAVMLTPIGVPAGYVAIPMNIGSAILAGMGAGVPVWIARNPGELWFVAGVAALAFVVSLWVFRTKRDATAG